ncbi:MAG: hypothetical protein WCX77_03195 [Candidatus Paceibacterota bacterium]|jgi:hypothetical protein
MAIVKEESKVAVKKNFQLEKTLYVPGEKNGMDVEAFNYLINGYIDKDGNPKIMYITVNAGATEVTINCNPFLNKKLA